MGWGASEGWGQTNPILLPSLLILSRPPNVLLHHLLAPLSRAMIYPQLAQPSTPASPLCFTLLTPHHNLLCHPDLPALSHSKQTTTHGWSQKSQDVSCPLAQFAPAHPTSGEGQWPDSGRSITPLIKTSIALSNPMETRCKKKQLAVWSTKAFQHLDQQSNKALYIGFVACQSI